MPSRASPFVGALLISLLLLAPLAAHFALVVHRGMALAGILVAVQAALLTWIVLSPLLQAALRLAACIAVLLLVIGLSGFPVDGPLIASAVPHAMAYTALLTIFATSLGPGREAVVTGLARRSRGYLPPEVIRYTRRVTWAWCCFFVVQLLGSLLLLMFAPLELWSLVINLCNLPLIVAMICAEYVYRQRRHAARPPERLVDMLRVFRQIRVVAMNEDQ